MSYLKSFGTGFVWICTILAAITFIPGLPPHLETSPYSLKTPVALNKQRNNKLNEVEKLFEGEIKGPESFDIYDKVLYTTLHGGTVGKIVGNKIVDVVKFGKKCDGIWQEEKCGRPLGLKFDKKGNLYVVDAYYGIFKVDVKTKKYEKIVDISKPIDGRIPKLPNSIDVASNGDLYWTDSSSDFILSNGVFSMLANPSGRLIRYNEAMKKNEVLLTDLGFANGIKLSVDESFLLVAETMNSRIIKYHIKGPLAGKSEIFIESLPGLPDNIHEDGNGNFIVSLVIIADEEHPVLTQSLAPLSNLRKMLLRLISLVQAPFTILEKSFPNYYFQRIVHHIGHFESIEGLNAPGATVLRIDPNGKILDVLDNNDEKLSGISSAIVLGDYLYLGSPFNDFLARVPLKKALPGFEVAQKLSKKKTQETTKQVPSNTEKPLKTTPKPTTASTPAPASAPTPTPTPTPAPTPAPAPAPTLSKKIEQKPKKDEKSKQQQPQIKAKTEEKPLPIKEVQQKKQDVKPVREESDKSPKKHSPRDEM